MIRNTIRNMLLNIGWDVRRTASWESERRARYEQAELDKWKLLKTLNPHGVLDIGANTGQFAKIVRTLLPDTRIISFEPLQDCLRQLEAAKQNLAPIEVMPFALGNEDTSMVMNRNDFTPSSSLLPMEDLHKQEIPKTEHTTPETIQIRRLDGIAPQLNLPSNIFIKIDVQGYTAPVLQGGEQTIRKSIAVVAEVSLRPLYKGETTFEEAWNILTGWGFAYRGNVDQWVSHRDGRILQCDCLFENVELCPVS